MKEKDNMMEPTFVHRDGMLADKEYVEWLADLKRRYRQSQLRAAVKANNEILEYYWNLGRDIVAKKAESKWGSGFFNQLSLDIRAMFPGEKGFSSANLRYMKRWFEFYYQRIVNLHQAGEKIVQRPIEEIGMENRHQPADEIRHQVGDIIVHQAGEKLEMPAVFGIVPWKHHVHIFTKSQSLDEALFYINKVATEGWSRALLEHHIAANYERKVIKLTISLVMHCSLCDECLFSG